MRTRERLDAASARGFDRAWRARAFGSCTRCSRRFVISKRRFGVAVRRTALLRRWSRRLTSAYVISPLPPRSGPLLAVEVEDAAAVTAARGATAAAAELFELAAELAPSDRAGARRRLLRAAEGSHRLAGSARAGCCDARGAFWVRCLPASSVRTFWLRSPRRSAVPRHERSSSSARHLRRSRDDRERSARILSWRAWLRAVAGGAELAEALADARAAVELAERAGDPTVAPRDCDCAAGGR